MRKQLANTIIIILISMLAASCDVLASGFALLEQNASGMGNAYAGGAAVAEDASTIFFNPAGLSRLSGKQIVAAVHAIRPSLKFSGTGIPGADMGGDAGSLAFTPNGYFAMEITPEFHAGLGIGVPFGLKTEYSPAWAGRVHAIKSKLEAINLNPSLAYRMNDSISLGAGINYQRIRGEITSNAAPTASVSILTGSDSSWGYNLGILINADQAIRFGLSYRSGISYNLNGQANFTAPLSALSGSAALAVKMPATLSASIFRHIDNHWDAMLDATWTGWNVFRELRVVQLSAPAVIAPVSENWRNTLRVAAGANYHYSDRWTLRMGAACDQTPVPDAFRTARIPDENRFEIALGGQYRPGRDSAIDVGYTHLFIKNASINSTAYGVTLSGAYKDSADILSVQYMYNF